MPTFYSIGFFGAPNIGDELLCQAVSDCLENCWPGCRLFVLTADPNISRRYTKTSAMFVEGFAPQPEYLQNFKDHRRAIREADLLIVGGGGLIADRYSWAGLIRYAVDASLGIFLGKNFVLVGLGATRVRRRWLRPVAGFLCREAASVFCRDEESAALVSVYGDRGDVIVAPDIGYVINQVASEMPESGQYALINIREFPSIEKEKLYALSKKLVAEIGDGVLLAAEPGEARYFRQVLESFPDDLRRKMRICEPSNLEEVFTVIRGARVVVAERLHVNLIAMLMNRPTLTIYYENKVRYLMESAGRGQFGINLSDIGEQAAERALTLETPDWSSRTVRESEAARRALCSTVEQGLRASPPRWGRRLVALAIFASIMMVTMIRTPLLLAKRSLFGRGPVKASWVQRKED